MGLGAHDDAQSVADKLHRIAALQFRGILQIAIDAPARNALRLPEPIEAAMEGSGVRRVRIGHADVDGAVWPYWLRADTATSEGSQLVRCSVEHAFAEAEPSILRRGAGRRLGGWFATNSPVDAAIAHWGSQMIRRRSDGSTCLLRLHDPAVLWALWHLLSPPQRCALIGPLQTLALIDPTRQLRLLTVEEFSDPQREASQLQPVWPASLWTDIDHIAAFNAALREQPVAPLDLNRAHGCVFKALRRARAMRYSHPDDLALFAFHALSVHPEFDLQPAMQALLKAAPPESRYTDIVGDCTELEWDAARRLGREEWPRPELAPASRPTS